MRLARVIAGISLSQIAARAFFGARARSFLCCSLPYRRTFRLSGHLRRRGLARWRVIVRVAGSPANADEGELRMEHCPFFERSEPFGFSPLVAPTDQRADGWGRRQDHTSCRGVSCGDHDLFCALKREDQCAELGRRVAHKDDGWSRSERMEEESSSRGRKRRCARAQRDRVAEAGTGFAAWGTPRGLQSDAASASTVVTKRSPRSRAARVVSTAWASKASV